MLKEKQDTIFITCLRLVNKQSASLQQLTVTLEREVKNGLQQWMTRSEQLGGRVAFQTGEALVEGDSLITRKHLSGATDYPVPLTNSLGDPRDLESKAFSFGHTATQTLEAVCKPCPNMMWLQLACFGLKQILTNAFNIGGIEDVRSECMLRDILGQAFTNSLINYSVEARPYVRAITISDRLDEQIPQRAARKRSTEHVEHLPPQGSALFLQLVKEAPVYLALSSAVCDQVPEVADLGLANPMNPAKPLFYSVGVPGQVIIDE
jgi:hypothetical protein